MKEIILGALAGLLFCTMFVVAVCIPQDALLAVSGNPIFCTVILGGAFLSIKSLLK